MTEKINIAELLENCPKGMELYSPIFGELKFNEVNAINNRILVVQQNGYIAEFESDGRLINCKNGECLLFPSKYKTTWEGFVPPCGFKDGDIITCNNSACTFVSIFKDKPTEKSFQQHCSVILDCNNFIAGIKNADYVNPRFATEEEKQKLFDVIKDDGYKWNPETKTLEKLAEPSEGTLVQIDFTRELRIADEVEVILGDYEFVLKDGKTYFVKKNKYPKTYEECCNILGVEDRENGYCGYEYELLGEFQQLLICRDAYWKIAGEELGLGKPWEPDFTNNDEERYGIYTLANKVERDFCGVGDVNMVLSFPTEEMRDIFYKNFMDLIEGCKKLL